MDGRKYTGGITFMTAQNLSITIKEDRTARSLVEIGGRKK
jgi:hypothetical protein